MPFEIHPFYDTQTSTLTYVVFDPDTRDAVLLDPVLEYEPVGSRATGSAVAQISAFIESKNLNLKYILETHAHADHLSGAQAFKARYPDALTAINARITEVQAVFKGIFALPESFATDGRQFDQLLHDGDLLEAGSLRIKVMATPGHTPACTTFQIGDAVFTGDLMFMPDQGTGRCDFPKGSIDDMYRSVTDLIFTLPDATRVFVGHDYQPGGRAVAWETTVGAQKAKNVQLSAETTHAEFAEFRAQRDAGLNAPRLLYQSVQVNIDGGIMPRVLRIPLNVFPKSLEGQVQR